MSREFHHNRRLALSVWVLLLWSLQVASAEPKSVARLHPRIGCDNCATTTIISGDGQTGGVSTTLQQSLSVKIVFNFDGSPLETGVAFILTSPPGSTGGYLTGANGGEIRTGQEVDVATGPDGTTSVQLTLGNLPGQYQVTMSCSDTFGCGTVTFTEIAVSTPKQLQINTGNNQTGGILQTLPQALVVKVTNSDGTPAVGTSVSFAIAQEPAGILTHATLSAGTATTGADGTASTQLILGDQPGQYQVIASCALGQTCTPSSVTFTETAGPSITTPSDGASPQSQFVAISGKGIPGDELNVLVAGAPVGQVVVDSEGNWEALPYVAPFGPSVTIQVQDESNFDLSNMIAVHPYVAPPLGIVGPAINYTRLLPLRKADIFVTADPSSAQVWFYGATYTHTALYLGGDADGTPWIAEAVTSTEAEANIFGQVRSVPLEHSLAWNGALTMTAWHPIPALSLPGATRSAIVAWAQNVTMQGLPYGNIASMSSEVLAADALFAVQSLTPTPALLTRFNGFLSLLNSAKNSITSFICSTLVWRAYWEGTGHSLDISTPNNITATPGSVLGNLPTPFRSAFIAQLASVFLVPQTFATSPKMSQVF